MRSSLMFSLLPVVSNYTKLSPSVFLCLPPPDHSYAFIPPISTTKTVPSTQSAIFPATLVFLFELRRLPLLPPQAVLGSFSCIRVRARFIGTSTNYTLTQSTLVPSMPANNPLVPNSKQTEDQLRLQTILTLAFFFLHLYHPHGHYCQLFDNQHQLFPRSPHFHHHLPFVLS